jgi:ParB family chromosome partitioning protein
MALGKGLNALLQDAERDIRRENSEEVGVNRFVDIPLGQVEANPFQPRVEFDEEALDELAQSIKVHGLIQPITVRKIGKAKYQIISGERRFRASMIANLPTVPSYIREVDDVQSLEMALIENIQRENLNPMEVANSYRRLVEECNLIQEDLSKRVGKKRSTVANYLRLLKLPTELQIALRANLISMGHARALIVIDNPAKQKALLEEILENDYSVRQVERLVTELLDSEAAKSEIGSSGTAAKPVKQKEDYDSLLWQEKFSKACNRSVKIKLKPNGKGEIVLPFTEVSELEIFLQKLG